MGQLCPKIKPGEVLPDLAEEAAEHQYPHLLRIPLRARRRCPSGELTDSQRSQILEYFERIPLGSPPSYQLRPLLGSKKWLGLTNESSLRSSLSESSLWHLQMFQEDMSPRSSLILTMLSALHQTPLPGSYPSMVPRLRKRGRAVQSLLDLPKTSSTHPYQDTVTPVCIRRASLS